MSTQPNPPDPPTPDLTTPPEEPLLTPPPTTPEWTTLLMNSISNPAILTIDLLAVTPGPSEANQALVDNDLKQWLPPVQVRRRAAPRFAALPTNRRNRRRSLYARTQESWKKNRGRCAADVLSGAWEAKTADVPLVEQLSFWKPLFENPSRSDSRTPTQVRDVQWDVMRPISNSEVSECLRLMSSTTAPGPDSRSLKNVKLLPVAHVSSRLNLWLLTGCLPSTLYEGYTTLIPKEIGTNDPAKFRPITVSSILTRLFHKILARRLDVSCPPSERQKAFRSGDGLAENVSILKHVLSKARDHKKTRRLHLAYLDVRKTFDSVSHESIVKAGHRAGIPPPLLDYIRDLYANSRTRLKVGGILSEPICAKQGVKQGDLLSCILFNLVIDWGLSALDPNLGFESGPDVRLNHLAFADDLILMSETVKGLQRQIDAFTGHLALSGLEINAGKCASVSLVVQARTAKSVVDVSQKFVVRGTLIKPMSVDDFYKYLGVQISAAGSAPMAESKLTDALLHISKAPLKPQQRMWILSTKVIPSLLHQLVLAKISLGFLRHLDRIIRSAVRKWCKLPKDTVVPFFYASVKDGGLGLMCLEHSIPDLRVRRRAKMYSSSDPVALSVARTDAFRAEITRWSTPRSYRGHLMSSKGLRQEAWSATLHQTVDGRGLRDANLVPYVHEWVSSGRSLLSGAKFCAALGVRAGTLPTCLHASRGRPNASKTCDCCGEGVLESLSHILNVCPRTHGARIK